jgi:methanogenic corrinoid protein MtbC1
MSHDSLIERFFETLITGNRPAARKIVLDAYSSGYSPADLYTEIFWPTYQLIDRMFRNDQLSLLSHHMSTRLLRTLVDQTASMLPQREALGRRVLCFCGPTEADEMGAQMAVDLLESQGFSVTFGGGGIANDEILPLVQESQPDVLLLFASAPQDLPNVRTLIDHIREIGACPSLQIAVGAGVFARAEGLAEEMGADLWADSPMEMVDALISEPNRRSDSSSRSFGKQRRPGQNGSKTQAA